MKPKVEVIKKALLHIVELKTEEHDFLMIFEFYPRKKMLSVPNGTSAFYRRDASNVVIVATWNNHTAENLAIARRKTKDLMEIIVAAEKDELGLANTGYGNYGTCSNHAVGYPML